MSSTRQTLLCCFGVLALTALPLACASESQEPSSSSTTAFEAPIGCGGTAACGQEEFCKFPVGTCSNAGPRGFCQARPELCPMVLMPVCGCDDVTYTNACEATRAGMNIKYERACGPFFCGGPDAIACGQNQYCAAADCESLGFCTERPTVCEKTGTPVCGCDRKDYASACEAHAAGVTVLAHNTCPVVPWVPSATPELTPPHSRAPQAIPLGN